VVAELTRQWFADSSVSYALAVIKLFEYAREHDVRYVYGPLDPESMRHGGLTVSGSAEDLDQAAAVLAVIPGLAESPITAA
jgi:hypothetical protein